MTLTNHNEEYWENPNARFPLGEGRCNTNRKAPKGRERKKWKIGTPDEWRSLEGSFFLMMRSTGTVAPRGLVEDV